MTSSEGDGPWDECERYKVTGLGGSDPASGLAQCRPAGPPGQAAEAGRMLETLGLMRNNGGWAVPACASPATPNICLYALQRALHGAGSPTVHKAFACLECFGVSCGRSGHGEEGCGRMVARSLLPPIASAPSDCHCHCHYHYHYHSRYHSHGRHNTSSSGQAIFHSVARAGPPSHCSS